ncbi:unnamed protein product [Symbiodinium sp. KB8]|nr:unnamed protein product [Symbiodinium sp. KB8]
MEFVKQLFDAFTTDFSPHRMGCLRNKNSTNPDLSDVELFKALPMKDLWEDADLPAVYFYLRRNKYLMIPPSWEDAISQFDKELDAKVAEANLASLKQQLAAEEPAPVPSAVPGIGAPDIASSSGNFVPGDATKALGNLRLRRSDTVEMLKKSSKYEEQSAPTEISSTPRKPPTSKNLGSIDIVDTPEPSTNKKPSPASGSRAHAERQSRPDVRRQLFPHRRATPKKKVNTPKPDGYWKLLVLSNMNTARVVQAIDVEGVLEKWHIQKRKSDEMGGMVTKQWLIEVRKFTPSMADNAFDWARRNGRLYKSEIHGEEEADIPLEWTWKTSSESGQKIGFASSFSMDATSRISGTDPNCALLDAENEDLGRTTRARQGEAASDSVATAQAGASFKMCFPSLQQNASPLGLLSSYICVLGKKIDLAETVKVSAKSIALGICFGLAQNVQTCLVDMNECYKKLTQAQASAATTDNEKELARCKGNGGGTPAKPKARPKAKGKAKAAAAKAPARGKKRARRYDVECFDKSPGDLDEDDNQEDGFMDELLSGLSGGGYAIAHCNCWANVQDLPMPTPVGCYKGTIYPKWMPGSAIFKNSGTATSS